MGGGLYGVGTQPHDSFHSSHLVKVPFSWPIAFDLRGFLVLSDGRGSLGTRSCLRTKIFNCGRFAIGINFEFSSRGCV